VDPRLRPFIALLITQVAFASLAVAGKVVLQGLPPLVMAALRVFFATIFLAAIAFTAQRERVARRDVGLLVVFALLGVVINQVLFLEGLSRTSAINASILIATIPVFTTGIAILSGREAARPARILGIVVAFLGALVLLRVEDFDLGDQAVVGNLMVMTNALSYSFYLVFSRPLLHRYRSSTVVAWTFAFGMLFIVPLGAYEAASLDFARVPMSSWLGMVWVILVGSVVSYSLNNYALKRLSASTVATWAFLQPVMGVSMALVLLPGETLGPRAILGGALVLLGVLIVSRLERYEPLAALPEAGEPMNRDPIVGPNGGAQPQPEEDDQRGSGAQAPRAG
jgi:drug/metabolite transporter (DMT)-like permease